MATNAAGSTVIELATHPVWCSSRQYLRDLAEAKRRHPSSYRPRAEGETRDARVIPFPCALAVNLNAVGGPVPPRKGDAC